MTAATLSGVAAAFGLPDQALAHALQGRSDLPIPIWLFAWGASLVLILSFALFAVLWQKPRLQEEQWRPVAPVLGKLLCGRVSRVISGLFGISCLFLVVYSGLAGIQDAALNFSVTFVFVTFWIGIPVISAIFGNLFAYLSPWRALAEWVARAAAPLGMKGAGLAYPERLGRWPAVVVLILFGWLELIGGAGISLITPKNVAILTLAYSGWTFLGMYLFGIRVWSERGEAFAVYFEMFSRLSSLEMRGGVLGVRKFLSGVPSWSTPAGSAALVLVAIGITTFDGAQEGAMQSVIGDTTSALIDLGLGGLAAFRLAGSVWMAIVLIVVSGLFVLGVKGMHTVKGSPPVRDLIRSFSHTLIPIALAYLVAHYFSFLVFQEQAQFTYLLSDPLGVGSDLFGGADAGIDYSVVGVTLVWYVQVAALVAGHIAGLALAHDRAIATYSDPQMAFRSQYWLLAVMVSFTCLGLYLLSYSNS
jgi:hypothetical protein